MENNKVSYLKTDDNKIINERCIVWAKKMDECLDVCIKMDGCFVGSGTHRICKVNNIDSYNKLNKNFD